MDLTFSSDAEEFRAEVREWLERNVPREKRPTDGPAVRDFDMAWQRRQFEGGWAGVSWPKEYGGRGLSLVQQLVWHEEYARAGAPRIGSMFIAVNHAGPTLILRGSEAQKSFHLPRILRGEALWCQGFSEPASGSDLASVSTTGRIEGDEIVIDGQKIWTTYAFLADYQELLVRTDPGASSRHRGLTWVIGDMHAPGISVRPIRDMTGATHFAQVFYDNVRLPLSNVVGAVNDGWNVAMTTLSFERGTALVAYQIELQKLIDAMVERAGRTRLPGGGTAIEDDAVRMRLAGLKAEISALRAMTYMSVSRNARQAQPGAEGTLSAVYFAELAKRTYEAAVDLLGAEGLERSGDGEEWIAGYLEAFKHTIAGGTSEIRRNVIGERYLGLPR